MKNSKASLQKVVNSVDTSGVSDAVNLMGLGTPAYTKEQQVAIEALQNNEAAIGINSFAAAKLAYNGVINSLPDQADDAA